MRHVFLQATPIDVGPILHDKPVRYRGDGDADFGNAGRGGRQGFEYIRQRLGVEHARDLVRSITF